MSAPLSLTIRDGIATDIAACLALDHTYETEIVWQMNLLTEQGGWRVQFRPERLPRLVEYQYPSTAERLEALLPAEHCFLVAGEASAEDALLWGYLTMRIDPLYHHALIHDIVVSRPFRRAKIGSRLLNVAQRWAQEHEIERLLIEVHNQNYPAIQFVQTHGFTFCGFNDHYFPKHEIAVFFSQSLR